MKTIARVHVGNLGKAFSIVLLALTATWLAVSYLFLRDFYVGRPILVVNLVLSAVLGWLYYKYRYQKTFSYDANGFRLREGRSVETARSWKDFGQISLFHLGSGGMAVRLYLREAIKKDDEITEFVEIPASDLQLDAFAFRDEIMPYILEPRRRKKPSEVSKTSEGESVKSLSTAQ